MHSCVSRGWSRCWMVSRLTWAASAVRYRRCSSSRWQWISGWRTGRPCVVNCHSLSTRWSSPTPWSRQSYTLHLSVSLPHFPPLLSPQAPAGGSQYVWLSLCISERPWLNLTKFRVHVKHGHGSVMDHLMHCIVPPENCAQKKENCMELISGNAPLIQENCSYVLWCNFDYDKWQLFVFVCFFR